MGKRQAGNQNIRTKRIAFTVAIGGLPGCLCLSVRLQLVCRTDTHTAHLRKTSKRRLAGSQSGFLWLCCDIVSESVRLSAVLVRRRKAKSGYPTGDAAPRCLSIYRQKHFYVETFACTKRSGSALAEIKHWRGAPLQQVGQTRKGFP